MTTALVVPTDDRTDGELVAATRAGDDRAFERLYARYHRRVAGYAQSMVGDWAKAEDVTQEVFISALRRMRQTERPIAFRPWVFEIARNACIDHFRRTHKTVEVPLDGHDGGLETALPAGDESPETVAETGQRLDHLLGAFGSLAPSHHEILVLRELEGRSYREIAEQMGLTRHSVESTLFRARRRLEEEYDELATGRRCERVTVLLEEGVHGRRDERRLSRHLAFCRTCRRRALAAGVEPGPFSRVARRAAALLPLPAVLRTRLFGGGHGSLAGLTAGPAGDGAAGWSKGAVAAVALLVAGTGAGIATHAASSSPLDRHVLPRSAATTPAAHDKGPADGRMHLRHQPRTAAGHAGARGGHRHARAGGAGHAKAGASGARGATATRPGHLRKTRSGSASPAAVSPTVTSPTPTTAAPAGGSSGGGTSSGSSGSPAGGSGGVSSGGSSSAGSTSSSGGGVVGTTVGTVKTTVGSLGTKVQQTTGQLGAAVNGTLGNVQHTAQAVTPTVQHVVGTAGGLVNQTTGVVGHLLGH